MTAPVDHPCCVCGDPFASFGVGVSFLRGIAGKWYCRAHRPKKRTSVRWTPLTKSAAPQPQPAAKRGSLL